ncbi:MAG: glycoside hydrolase, partial [Chloroflexi bacterium]|nr:glycoside hydrolase [Chloroflexota bacterium]
MHDDRVTLASDATWPIGEVDRLATDVMDPDTGSLDDVEVDGIATRTDKSVTAVLWHHRDDQYATAIDAQVTVTVTGLPFDANKAVARNIRIDRSHSNAHAVWESQGRPQHPTADQIAELHARDGL